MSYLIDTDIISLFERKNVPDKLTRWFEGKETFLSTVTLAELEFGLKNSPPAHQPDLKAWVEKVRLQYAESTKALTLPVLMRWKELLVDLRKKNRAMTCEDSLIAATALHLGYKVVTRNVRHFEPSGVECVNPLTA